MHLLPKFDVTKADMAHSIHSKACIEVTEAPSELSTRDQEHERDDLKDFESE